MSRAEWLRQAARDGLTVQAPRFTEGRRRSPTELARILARDAGWGWDGDDQLVDEDGELVAYTIEDAAAAMHDLGWFAPAGAGLAWSEIPHAYPRGARAAAPAERLVAGGQTSGRLGSTESNAGATVERPVASWTGGPAPFRLWRTGASGRLDSLSEEV